MEPHFGRWLKKIRNRLGIDQMAFAALLGLTSYQAVLAHEKKAGRGMRGSTTEGLLELIGYGSEAELDAAWTAGRFPPTAELKARAEAMRRAQSGALLPAESTRGGRGVDAGADLVLEVPVDPETGRRLLLLAEAKRSDAALLAADLIRLALLQWEVLTPSPADVPTAGQARPDEQASPGSIPRLQREGDAGGGRIRVAIRQAQKQQTGKGP